ncbi:MAG: IS66 family insertion sequence element accessory protein TnpB [Verrucomicrobiae bacterium]|nr:IS66 family insertion sequence element accessory protein TnpB [Verrucomicrobiae bacterium]
MIQITPQMRLLVAVEPVDFRKGIDGLAALCRSALGSDPLSGALFIFRSRNRRALKLLVYDGQGFWLFQKRLSAGAFAWWPEATGPAARLEVHQLQMLLWNGDPSGARAAPMWRALPG